MRFTEIETELEAYRTRTQIETIELKDKLETANQKLESMPNFEELVKQLNEAQYNLALKEAEIEKLKADFKEQHNKKQEDLVNIQGTITVKDEYIKELEEKNDEFQAELEKIGYETFIQVKNDLFSKD